jgi:general secretion pathway protein G
MMATSRRYGGFTFVELMMTLAIMAVLALVSVPLAQLAAQRQKEHELRAALAEIRQALDAYKRASDQGRVVAKLGESGYPPSLETLMEGVEDQRSPARKKIYFLRRIPRDPMVAGSETDPAGHWGLRSYDSPPEEPAEGDDVFDVYSTSDRVGLNNVPYRDW